MVSPHQMICISRPIRYKSSYGAAPKRMLQTGTAVLNNLFIIMVGRFRTHAPFTKRSIGYSYRKQAGLSGPPLNGEVRGRADCQYKTP
jgi:hypothetical protein